MHKPLSVMNLQTLELIGSQIRNNAIYNVIDNMDLDDFIVSQTQLHPKQETSGHYHKETDEVYIFTQGRGILRTHNDIDGKGAGEYHNYTVGRGSIILIPKGWFHQVVNTEQSLDLNFISLFKRYGDRGQ